MPRNVAPNGFPTCRRCADPGGFFGVKPWRSSMVVLSLKSCVTAIPMEAKASEVRSQARKVRSSLA